MKHTVKFADNIKSPNKHACKHAFLNYVLVNVSIRNSNFTLTVVHDSEMFD